MSNIFFFTDVDLLNEQTPEQAYGPVVGYEETQYRVTSIHSAHVSSSELKDMPRAIAVLKGRVVIQRNNDDTGNELVNLALYPDEQISQCDTDSKNAPKISYSPIKCILYKGLKRESILADAQTIQKESEYGSDLLRRLWANKEMNDDARAKANLANNEAATPSSNKLGYEDGGDDSNDMDGLFYKEDYDINPPISVEAGMVLGCFAPEKFGIEIIFESVRYSPKVRLLRHLETIITVPQTEQASADERQKKDEVLNFIDPCAFYGSLYRTKIKYKTHDDTTDEVSRNDIYSQLLSKFHNKNNVYIDIRNEYNQSFNYLRNYDSDTIHLYIGDNGNFTSPDYYQECHWPILIQDMKCPSDAIFMKISLELPYDKAENPNPLLYVVQGFVPDKRNQFPYEPEDFDKFTQIQSNKKEQDYTKPFTVCVPVVDGDSMSSYIRLKYLNGNSDEDLMEGIQANSPTNSRNTFWDNMIMPLQMKIPYKVSGKTMVKVYDEEYFISAGREFVASLGVAEDENNIMYFAVPKVYWEGNKISLGRKKNGRIESGLADEKTIVKYIEKKYADCTLQPGLVKNGTSDSNSIYIELKKKTWRGNEDFFGVIFEKESFKNLLETFGNNASDVCLIFEKEDEANKQGVEKYAVALGSYDGRNLAGGHSPKGVYGKVVSKRTPYLFVEESHTLGYDLPVDECDPELLQNENVLKALFEFQKELSSIVDTDGDGKIDEEAKKNYPSELALYYFGKKIKITKDTDPYTNKEIYVPDFSNVKDIPNGYLAEYCTIFTLWYMRSLIKEGKIASIPNGNIYNELKNSLLFDKNGETFGFKEIPDDVLKDLLDPDLCIGNSVLSISSNSLNDIERFNNRFVSYMYRAKDNYVFSKGKISNNKVKFQNTATWYIYMHLIKLREIYTKNVQQYSSCLYQNFRPTTIIPQSMMVAVGDGSKTIGLLEEDKNYGVMLFHYQYDDKNFLPSVQNIQKIRLFVEDDTAIHFSIMGVEKNITDPVFFAVKINDYFHCFTVSKDRKIQPVKNIVDDLSFLKYNWRKLNIDKTKISTYNNGYFIYEGGTIFYDHDNIEEHNIEEHNIKDNVELHIENSQKIEIILYSKFNEVQMVLNITEATTKTKQVILHLHNLFEDDRFELERIKKFALLENRKKEFDEIIDSILYDPSNLDVEVTLRGNFVGKDTNPKSTKESKLISDKSYYFNIPYSSRKKELAGGDNLEAYKYSYAKIEYNNSRLTINIESYVSPVRSRLDRRMKEDNYTLQTEEAKQAKINELNLFTRYGNEANSDAYVELEDHSRIPSYNPILSAFRSFGVLEAIRDILIDEAKVLGKTPEEIEAISNVLDIDNRSIKVDLTKGIAKEIKYTDYNDFKWYRDATEESEFKNTEN